MTKDLKQELNDKELEVEALKAQLRGKQKELNKLETAYKHLCDSRELKVSDHATLRYMERIEGIDVDYYRDKILDKEILRQVERLGGNGTYVSEDRSYRVRIENNTVLTVISESR